MDLLSLSFAYLRYRPLHATLNLLLFAFGVATMVIILLISAQLDNNAKQQLHGIDLVVGAKGSPMQLILSTVFHLDVPTGNIPLDQATELGQNPLIASAIPMALSDNFHGFRIVGTTLAYPQHYGAKLAEGEYWQAPMEAVLGAQVALHSKLGVGGTFVGSHGFFESSDVHSDYPYVVTGVIAPTGTVVDRLIFTSPESVWKIHEHRAADKKAKAAKKSAEPKIEQKEITALLITYRSPEAAETLPAEINLGSSMQAASPATESARLMNLLGVGLDTLRYFGMFLVGFAGVGIFGLLFNALSERRFDLAILRVLGARRSTIACFLLQEGLLLSALGTLLGIGLGHALVATIGSWLAAEGKFGLTGATWLPEEWWIVGAGLSVGVMAAIIPAMRAGNANIAHTLNQ